MGEDAEALVKIGTRLPPELAELVTDEERVRPDILIAHHLGIPHLAEMHIVEIKYCRFTDRTARQQAGAVPWQSARTRHHAGSSRNHLHDMIEMLEAMQVAKREALRCDRLCAQHNVKTKWSEEHQHPHRDEVTITFVQSP
jgi:hypothetical protein